MTEREALRMALEALETSGDAFPFLERKAITAIKEALAQPVSSHGNAEDLYVEMSKHLNCPHCGGSGHIDDVAQPEQKPVRLRRGDILRCIETDELCTVWATSTTGKTLVKWNANNFGEYTAEQIGELFWLEPAPDDLELAAEKSDSYAAFHAGYRFAIAHSTAHPEQEPNKNGSPCPEFWDWLPKAYNFDGNGAFTKYNMEVAFLAGKQAAQIGETK